MRVSLVYLERLLDTSGLSVRHVTSDPLGLRYLAGFLTRAGHHVCVHLQHHKSLEQVADDVLTFAPSVLGISSLTYNTPLAQRLAQLVKARSPQVTVVFGGEHPSLSPETTFTEDVDFVVKGEGELTFLELIRAIEHQKHPEEVQGLFYRCEGHIRYTGARQPADIDALAWPLRERSHVMASRMNSFFFPSPDQQTGLVTMLASRGCSFACTYCTSHDLWGNRTRYRDPGDVADEIEHCIREFSANVVVFYDLTFNLNPAYVNQLCDEFLKRGLPTKASFYATCRISTPSGKLMLTHALLGKMKAAGFVKIGVGLESVNEKIAGAYKGGCSPWTNVVHAVHTAHDLGILVRLFVMLGGPEETPETYQEMKNKLNELPAHDLRVGFVTPLPGTQFDREIPLSRRFSLDFSKYDCTQPIAMNQFFTYEELVSMERDVLRHFHSTTYRAEVIADIVEREPRLRRSAEWRVADLQEKGLLMKKKDRSIQPHTTKREVMAGV